MRAFTLKINQKSSKAASINMIKIVKTVEL